MKFIKWLNDNLEKYVTMILMVVMTFIIFIQVIMRYIFNNSLSWSEELARYIFIWLVYIGISLGCKERAHLRIDAFINVFPQKTRKYIVLLADFIFLGFSIYVFLTGVLYVRMIFSQGDLSPALRLPMWMIDMAPCCGFGLCIIREIQNIVWRIKKLRNKEDEY